MCIRDRCAIYYGAMYGGTITSVLINVPGEAASVITCIDGYAMARQRRAGAALARHGVAVDAGDHRGRLARHVDQHRGDGAAIHGAVVDGAPVSYTHLTLPTSDL